MSQETVAGSCVCGAVRYTIEPQESLGFQYCHCSRCRKASGSAHAANLFVATANLTWTSGEEHVKRFELPDAKYWCSSFCDICGSSLPWLSRTGKAYIVPVGTLDGDPGVKPTRNVYVDSGAPWYVHASELESFAEGPPRK